MDPQGYRFAAVRIPSAGSIITRDYCKSLNRQYRAGTVYRLGSKASRARIEFSH